jgi:hypothetical protein
MSFSTEQMLWDNMTAVFNRGKAGKKTYDEVIVRYNKNYLAEKV